MYHLTSQLRSQLGSAYQLGAAAIANLVSTRVRGASAKPKALGKGVSPQSGSMTQYRVSVQFVVFSPGAL